MRSFLFLTFIGLALTFFSFQKKPKFNLKESIKRGEDVYLMNCLSCHMQNGEGLEGVYPPVAKSDYMMSDKARSIREVLYGIKGKITVNQKDYNGEMNGSMLSDQEVSDVLNYARNSWGNKGEAVTPEEVKAERK